MNEVPIDVILVDLFVLFALAKLLGELFDRFGQPEVVGELLAGVLVGPHVLGIVGHESEAVLEVIAELGVIILLFTVGLETSVRDLRRVGRQALLVGFLGVALPFLGGAGLMLGLDHPVQESLFVAVALVATSVGITARVLRDLGAVRTEVARVILGAAVVDDILAIMVLALIGGLAAGSLSTAGIIFSALAVVAFLFIVVVFGPRAVRKLSALAHTPLVPRSPFVFAVLLTLGLAALSGTIGLASIIGAFLAGMIFEFSKREVAEQIEPVSELLVPFFFAFTGSRLDPTVFGDASILGLASVITVIAVATKVIGGYLGSVGVARLGRITVGVGMVPRGEVGLIVASLGLSLGVISTDLFGVVVVMSLVTTVITPPVLGPLVRREKEQRRAAGRRADEKPDAEPAGERPDGPPAEERP